MGFFQPRKESRVSKNSSLSVFASDNYSLSLYTASFDKFLNVIIICVISSPIACACWEFLDALMRLIVFHSIESVVRQIKTNALPQVGRM